MNWYISSGLLILIFASVSVFSISSFAFNNAIFALVTLLGIWEWDTSLSIIIPLTSSLSSRLFPCFFITLTRSMSAFTLPSFFSDTSTIILAAGFWTSISFMIVAPSFVITISPMPATSILSIPRGPMVDRTISATILAAIMLLLWASLPLDLEVPSLRIKTGVSDISNQILSRADCASQDKHMQADS